MRVNDYNPLLLYVWKGNIDIQFVAVSSLALAHYVSGYVTEAERSNLQEIWQDVSENKSTVPSVAHLKVQVASFNTNLVFSPYHVPRQAIHFGKNLGDQVKGRSQKKLKSLIELP